MNKTLTLTILALLGALSLTLSSCNNHSRENQQLLIADSLLCHNNPDSALLLLESIDGSRLDVGDRAYHALLLTQSQYRTYANITSDSIINVALDYYEHHTTEREKLTRSYIYKGAVTEELGNPEVAMTYYKQAVNTALPTDHYNLGYAKLRIGCLYRACLVPDSSDISMIKDALRQFEQVPDSLYIANCLSTIGSSYVTVNNDSALVYLIRADSLAKAIGDKYLEITNLGYLADLKMFSHEQETVTEAKQIAQSALADQDCPLDERDHLRLAAAFTLAKLNKRDSAELYLKQINKDNLNDGLKVLHYNCLAELARCRGDINQYQHHMVQSDSLSDSMLTSAMQQRLREVEKRYDNEVKKNQAIEYRNKLIVTALAAMLCITVLGMTIMGMRRRLEQRRRLALEYEETIYRLQDDTALLTSRLNAHKAMSDELKGAFRQQLELFTQLVAMHNTQFANSPQRFSEAFAKAYRAKSPNNAFWGVLHAYVNSQFNHILETSVANSQQLIDSDINYLALYCCDLPATIVMACMGYKEVHSVYNKRRRVAEIVGYPNKLDAYVELFKSVQVYGNDEQIKT